MLPFKKVFLSAAALLVTGGLVFGTGLISYLRTAGTQARASVEEAVPIEFQLKRAQDMLQNELEPEIRRMKHSVAESEVDLKRMTAQLEQRATSLSRMRDEMLTRNDQLKSGKTSFTISNVSYSKKELETDLSKRLERVQIAERTLSSEEQVLAAKKRALAENEAKVVEMLGAREQLSMQIKELEARVSAVKAAETIQGTQFDESKLAEVRGLLDRVGAKVEVRERELALEGQTTDLIPVQTDSDAKNISAEVDAYFGQKRSDEALVDAGSPIEQK